jgi:hypothetical protein
MSSFDDFKIKLEEKWKSITTTLDSWLTTEIWSADTPEKLQISLVKYANTYAELIWSPTIKNMSMNVKSLLWVWNISWNTKDILQTLIETSNTTIWVPSTFTFGWLSILDYSAKLKEVWSVIKKQAKKIIETASDITNLPNISNDTNFNANSEKYLEWLKNLNITVKKLSILWYKDRSNTLEAKEKAYINALENKITNIVNSWWTKEDLLNHEELFKELDISFFENDHWFSDFFKKKLLEVRKITLKKTKIKDLDKEDWGPAIKNAYDQLVKDIDKVPALVSIKGKILDDTKNLAILVNLLTPLKASWQDRDDVITKFLWETERVFNWDLVPYMNAEWKWKDLIKLWGKGVDLAKKIPDLVKNTASGTVEFTAESLWKITKWLFGWIMSWLFWDDYTEAEKHWWD